MDEQEQARWRGFWRKFAIVINLAAIPAILIGGATLAFLNGKTSIGVVLVLLVPVQIWRGSQVLKRLESYRKEGN